MAQVQTMPLRDLLSLPVTKPTNGPKSATTWLNIRERLLYKTTLTPGGCWAWGGADNGNKKCPYGIMTIRGVILYAHRVSYELFVGPIPEELELDHGCRFTLCLNPYRDLEPVTGLENNRRAAAARPRKPRELAPGMVRALKIQELLDDGVTHRAIAKELGCSKATVTRLSTRRSWARLKSA